MLKKLGSKFTLYGLLGFFLIITCFPFIWMVSTSLKPFQETITIPPSIIPPEFHWQSYIEVLTEGNLLIYFYNSVIVSVATTFIAISIAILAGLGFSRFEFPLKNKIMIMFLVSQLFPLVLLATPYYTIMRNLGLLDTRLSLIITYISFVLPFSVWMMTNYFNTIPSEMEEAAMVDGCSKIGALFRVTLPISGPGIVAVAINAYILAWNEFTFAMTFIDSVNLRTLPVGLRAFMGEHRVMWNNLMAGAVIASVPVIILFIFLQKYLIAGLTAGGVKG